MELSSELVSVQGLLISVIKKTGEFTKINYRGGNEHKISFVVEALRKFLASNNDLKCNPARIENIILFLAINTVYKKQLLQLDDYVHLMNIMPQLSKCLLSNIVYELDLCSCYCKVIEKLPIGNGVELLDEIIICVRKSKPNIHCEWTYLLLKTVANKLSQQNADMDDDNMDNLNEISNIMMRNLTGLYSDKPKYMKTIEIYHCMGLSLLKLFDLLLNCDKDNLALDKFLDSLLTTCCILVRNISVNVYCSWAEIEMNDQVLQTVFSGKAYFVIEKYQKYEKAKELVNMLSAVAKKPKTLSELIEEADTNMIIQKIGKNDSDQKEWFQALLNTRVLNDQESINCINKWSNLCTESDVVRLLTLSTHTVDERAKKVVVKCAANLDLSSLLIVMSRHFHQHKFKDILMEDVLPQLIVILNKLNENEGLESLTKDIVLLFLQSPAAVSAYIYEECLKNSFYTSSLKKYFSLLKELFQIDHIGIRTLYEAIQKNTAKLHNSKNLIELLNTLTSTGCFSNDDLLLNIILPLLKDTGKEAESLLTMKFILEVLLRSQLEVVVKNGNRELINILLSTISQFRCNFLNFNHLNQEITKLCVEIVISKCIKNTNSSYKIDLDPNDDCFMTYYKQLLSSDSDSTLFHHLCPDLNVYNLAESIAHLLKVLPKLVTYEWIQVSKEIKNVLDIQRTVELYTDVIILLCEFVLRSSNEVKRQNENVALKYCIQQFGIVVQENLHEGCTLEEEVAITRKTCRLIKKLSQILEQEDIIFLTNLLTQRSLQFLSNEKEFMCIVALTDKPKIRETLLERMKC